MIINTRKLPATQAHGEQMRATSDSGVTLTIPFPYMLPDPDHAVARMLVQAVMPGWYVERVTGNRFRIVRD